jgi:serine/threonine protein kinase
MNAGDLDPADAAAAAGAQGELLRILLLERTGQGGMGIVYRAHDDVLGRDLAIKVPNPERITRPHEVEAFLTEARILARLDQPNIVPVHDVGCTEHGPPSKPEARVIGLMGDQTSSAWASFSTSY